MILYVNGDSHAAGAEINNCYVFANDDPQMPKDDRSPHPANIVDSFGSLLAEKLNYQFVTNARSGASNDRILRTTRDFLSKSHKDVFVVICWTTFDRKEFVIENNNYCFGPGLILNKVSDQTIQTFKKYISTLSDQKLLEQTQEFHDKIYNFHLELRQNNIKHLFFNSYQYFTLPNYNWNNQFIDPYSEAGTYYHWLTNRGYKSTNWYHFKKDGHAAWCSRLHNWLTDHSLL